MLICVHISILSDDKTINIKYNSSFNIEYKAIWGIYLNMKNNNYFSSQEIIETPKTEIVEENIYR